MILDDCEHFTLIARRHNGTHQAYRLTQKQAQDFLDTAGVFRPFVIAGLGKLENYRLPEDAVSRGEGIRRSDGEGTGRPEGATRSGEDSTEPLPPVGLIGLFSGGI